MHEFLQTPELWLPGMLAMLCLTVVSGFFSGSETALFYLSHEELRSFRIGSPRERVVAALLTEPDRLLTAILFWNLVVNLSYFAVSVVIAHRLHDGGQNAAAGIYGAGSVFAIILLGEVVPKSMAVFYRRRLSTLVCWPLAAAVRVLDPVIPALQRITLIVRRAFWPHIRREPYLEADDLERAVEASELSDEVIRQERLIWHNVLDLSEMTVEEVMWPRGTYLSLAPPVHLSDLKGEVPANGYLVVQAADSEDVEAAVPLANFADIPEHNLESVAEEVLHVPWCATLAYTLQFLRDRFCSTASVVNEYGATIGIVTYDDIIDTVLIPQPSRAKRLLRREPVLEVRPGCYHVEGITTLRYLCRRLHMEYEPTEEGPVTVTGLLAHELEHIPEVGDECTWQGKRLKVIDVSRLGQIRVMVEDDS